MAVAPVTVPYYQQGSLRRGTGETIEVKTVDNFCTAENIKSVDIFKTDTEGYEIDVLKGATNMLRARPIKYILAEATLTSPLHTNLFDLVEFLVQQGWRCLDTLRPNVNAYLWNVVQY